MAEQNPMFHNIDSVVAMYPRMNKTYRFDNAERKSVPCGVFEDGAAYTTSFLMTKAQAQELYAAMHQAYTMKREPSWPEKFEMPFKKREDGTYEGRARLKGAYGEDATRKPAQYDAKGVKLDDDFMLTSGSTVNIAIAFVPYNMREASVSLRLRAVQVVELKPMEEQNTFGSVSGYDSKAKPQVSGFELDVQESPFPVASEDEAEEEPKKTTKKKVAPKSKEVDPELSEILGAWED